MPTPKSPDAFTLAADLLDRALDSERGILYQTKTHGESLRMLSELRLVRRRAVDESRSIYPPDHPMYSRSVYDPIVIRVVENGLEILPEAPSNVLPPPHSFLCDVLEYLHVSLEFRDERSLRNFREACYACRRTDRNRERHPDAPMYKRSIFDGISIRRDPENPLVLHFEAGLPHNDNRVVEL